VTTSLPLTTDPGFTARVERRRRLAAVDRPGTHAHTARAPLVSVVIASYNGERFLRDTLESVLAQTWENLEVIVCDDGSSDGTLELLAGFRDRVLVHRQRNRGVSAARNRGACFAQGAYIAFIDHDDLWEPDMLERQVRLLMSRQGAGLVYGDSWIIDQDGRFRGRRESFLNYEDGEVYGSLLRGNFIPIETTVMPTPVFREIGGFDESLRYLEDYELYLRIAARYPVVFQHHPVARYRIHERNLSHDKEALLTEWVTVLDNLLERSGDRAAEERAILERQLARRRAEVAMQILRRGDVEEADGWLVRSREHCPAGLWRRANMVRSIMGSLPEQVRKNALKLLPRRRLYGL
jgi:glycosyltransferase involved in cell wall biosynthesis